MFQIFFNPDSKIMNDNMIYQACFEEWDDTINFILNCINRDAYMVIEVNSKNELQNIVNFDPEGEISFIEYCGV